MSELVLFDLDGTITRRDTYLAYLLSYLWHHPRRLVRSWLLPGALALYALRLKSNTWLKTTFLQAVCAGCSRDSLVAHSEAFVERILADGLRPGAQVRLAQHKAAGDQLVLVTASLDVYAQPLAARLGFDTVVCTRVALDGTGRLTGGLDGDNCYGERKLAMLRERLVADGAPRRPTRFYSDHHADLPLLAFVDHPVAVNPTPRLRRQAAALGIPLEDWEAAAPEAATRLPRSRGSR